MSPQERSAALLEPFLTQEQLDSLKNVNYFDLKKWGHKYRIFEGGPIYKLTRRGPRVCCISVTGRVPSNDQILASLLLIKAHYIHFLLERNENKRILPFIIVLGLIISALLIMLSAYSIGVLNA